MYLATSGPYVWVAYLRILLVMSQFWLTFPCRAILRATLSRSSFHLHFEHRCMLIELWVRSPPLPSCCLISSPQVVHVIWSHDRAHLDLKEVLLMGPLLTGDG